MAADEGEGQLVHGAGSHAGRRDPARTGGGDRDAIGVEAIAQLAGRLPGEGDDHGVIGGGQPLADAMGHP